ncbi:MAG: hypothetical protein ABSG49_02430 [Methanoregula sp.]|jgi:hypothetical protein|uniref:hypothetical protein n=1 Tax=Methanoregula sp. TaxID=2052170 RepID=UPI003C205F85
MDYRRIFLNVGFWIVFSFTFDALSGFVFPDLSLDATLFLWFSGLLTGTLIFNVLWYWFSLRNR